jgi:hypothetical protein
MYTEAELQEYLDEIRKQVCSRCIDRPGGGPPCAPLGKMCSVELFLPLLLKAIHEVDSPSIGAYVDNLRRRVCAHCVHQNADGFCLPRTERTCALDYLFPLIVEVVETVDQRRAEAATHTGSWCGSA